MSVLNVKCKNYKIHKELDINFNGKSAILLGDTGQGKSTILEIIEVCFLRKQFENPLSNGEEAGFIEMETEIDGRKYIISRTFSKDKKSSERFEVRSADGSTQSLTNLLKTVLGAAFTNKYFDYHTYFFEMKSPKARVEYLTKSIGDDKIQQNVATIKKLENERRDLGSQKKAQEGLFPLFKGLDKETILSKRAYYMQPQEIKLAAQAKEAYLKNKTVRLELLANERVVVAERVAKLQLVEQQLSEKHARIQELEAELIQLRGDVELLEMQKKDIPAKCVKELKTLDEKIEKGKVKNQLVEHEAQKLYEAEVGKISNFNVERANFINNQKAFIEFARLDKEWKAKDAEMDRLAKESKELFKDSIPIPELTYELNEKGDEMIMYKGREFSFSNISKGESIRIAAAIQRAMNPKGANFILIQEAQSLGSGVDEILEEAKKFDVQVIMEITQRDEPLKVVFLEDQPQTILTPKVKKAAAPRKKAASKADKVK